MKKRKELNALVKNNVRYKSMFRHSSAMDMFSLNSNGGAGRLLGKSNESSSENDQEYYFSANKQLMRERKRRNCCKLIQMTVFGFIITFAMICGITLLFSYSKFHEALKDLKSEFQSQQHKNELSLSEVKRKLDEFDEIFGGKDMMPNEYSRHNHTRSIRSVEMANQLNSYLIEYLFNQTKLNNFEQTAKSRNLVDLIINFRKIDKHSSVVTYQNLVNDFLKDKNQFSLINARFLDESLIKSGTFKEEILHDIKMMYIMPIVETLETCDCPVAKLINVTSIN